jgi:hypothetical protein
MRRAIFELSPEGELTIAATDPYDDTPIEVARINVDAGEALGVAPGRVAVDLATACVHTFVENGLAELGLNGTEE